MKNNVQETKCGVYDNISYSIRYSMDKSDFRINPDGSRFYKTHLSIVKDGHEIDIPNDIYFECKEDEGIWHSMCMAVDTEEDIITLFMFEKDENSNRYSMSGYVYEISNDSIRKFEVFERANWGWMPFFDRTSGSLILNAFSFAGYYSLEGTRGLFGWDMEEVASIMPDEFEDIQKKHDKVLFFSSKGDDEVEEEVEYEEDNEEEEEEEDFEFDDDFFDFLKNQEPEEDFTPCHKISEKIGDSKFYQLNQAAMWGVVKDYIEYRQSLLQCDIDVLADSKQYTFAIDSLNRLEGELAEYESLDDYASHIENEYLRGNFQAYVEFVTEMQFMSWAVYQIGGEAIQDIGMKYAEIYDTYLYEKRKELLNEQEAKLAFKILCS